MSDTDRGLAQIGVYQGEESRTMSLYKAALNRELERYNPRRSRVEFYERNIKELSK